MVKQTDQILFESLKNGEEASFKKVYQDNRQLFLNFARKYGLATEEILDVYQDAYIVFHENILNGKLVELKSSLSTYIISIGKYMIIDQLRKQNKKVDNEKILTVVGDVDTELESYDLTTETLSPDEVLLQKYFDQLGEKCKAILTLFYYKKYNIKQIMKEGNYNSENVVKSQKSRCLKTLKELFKSTPKNI